MICCITGHRPSGFPFGRNDSEAQYLLYKKILTDKVSLLVTNGFDHFISGMAEGADLDFAEAVLKIKNESGIILEAALPCPYSPKGETAKKRIIQGCDIVNNISKRYYQGCMQKRNRYMVDKSDLVIAVWNGKESGGTWNTIQYAKSKGKKIYFILLNQLIDVNT